MTQTKNTSHFSSYPLSFYVIRVVTLRFFSPCILTHSHFLFLCVIMGNIYIFKVKKVIVICSRPVERERVQDKSRDICQFQKAFSKERELINQKGHHKHNQITSTIKRN